MSAIETAAAGGAGGRVEITIRPGVTFPDWSAVSSEHVRQALGDILRVFGGAETWNGYGGQEDRVRRAILDLFAELGRPPSSAEVAKASAIPADDVPGLLASLRARDLVVLGDDGAVTGAYPLTARRTEHKVKIGGHIVNAMCAIDALGAGAMYGRDVAIDSECRNCGGEIHVETRDQGGSLGNHSPSDTLVWSGIQYGEGCAETSLCTVIAFFCSDRCLEAWRDEAHPDITGYRLSLDEGFEAGKAIFGPMLRAAESGS